MKSVIMKALAHEQLLDLTASLGKGHATIFVGHRFADDERKTPGHDPALLRRHLELLRRLKFNVVSLSELVRHLRDRVPLASRTVAFTFDDGYADFASVAAPIFAAYDYPATVFLTTGFLDREVWMWWDQITWAVLHTDHRAVELDVGGSLRRERWTTLGERITAAERIADGLKSVRDVDKWDAIARLARALDVAIPRAVPAEYAPMTWEQVRAWDQGLITFGPHTVTHPILAQVKDEQAHVEIERSWQRVREMVPKPTPVFCYPNGAAADFLDRDAAIARDAGLEAAVTTRPAYVDSSDYAKDSGAALFHLPRFGYPEPGDIRRNAWEFHHVIGNVERGKMWLRRTLKRSSA